MAQTKIALIVGSIRKDSFNLKFAKALTKLAPGEFSFTHLDISHLPLYNQDDDKNQAESVKQFKSNIMDADAVLFVTPEYNRSVPGVLKNAIDNASRPYGQSAWQGKPVGVIGVSVGAMGSALAQQHLRNMLAYLDMPTMAGPEAFIQVKEGLFDEAGNIGPNSKQFVQDWMNHYVAWVKRFISKL